MYLNAINIFQSSSCCQFNLSMLVVGKQLYKINLKDNICLEVQNKSEGQSCHCSAWNLLSRSSHNFQKLLYQQEVAGTPCTNWTIYHGYWGRRMVSYDFFGMNLMFGVIYLDTFCADMQMAIRRGMKSVSRRIELVNSRDDVMSRS